MNQDKTTLAGERTQPPIDNEHVAPGCEQFGSSDQTQPEPQTPGWERPYERYNGKTAKEWFEIHIAELKVPGNRIKVLEDQTTTLNREIRKHEELNAARLSKLHPQGVKSVDDSK
jgi:hypothetical protein